MTKSIQARWSVSFFLVLISTIVWLVTVPAPASANSHRYMSEETSVVTPAVESSVLQAQAGDAVPAITEPSLYNAPNDHANIGQCSAFGTLRSKICNYGALNGKKTIVVFGNSHAAMWVPAISAVAQEEGYKFYPIVKEACSFENFAGVNPKMSRPNQCGEWYVWAKAVIASLKPSDIVIGTYDATKYWNRGERAIVAQFKPLTHQVTLLSDTPYIPDPAVCLLLANATQETCLRTDSPSRVKAVAQVRAIATSEGVSFVDVTPWFCYEGLCPSVIDGYIPYADGSHVTEAYSAVLAPEMQSALALPALVPTPIVTSTTTTSSITTTLPGVPTTDQESTTTQWNTSALIAMGRWSGDGDKASNTTTVFSLAKPQTGSPLEILVLKKFGPGSAVCAAAGVTAGTTTAVVARNAPIGWESGWLSAVNAPFPCGKVGRGLLVGSSHDLSVTVHNTGKAFVCATVTWVLRGDALEVTRTPSGRINDFCGKYAIIIY